MFEHIRVVGVRLGQRTNAVVRKEFGFIERATQQPLHPMAPQQRQQMAIALRGLRPARNQSGKIGTIVEKPFQSCCEFRQIPEKIRLQHLRSEEHTSELQSPMYLV